MYDSGEMWVAALCIEGIVPGSAAYIDRLREGISLAADVDDQYGEAFIRVHLASILVGKASLDDAPTEHGGLISLIGNRFGATCTWVATGHG